jgi:hypothetical protein
MRVNGQSMWHARFGRKILKRPPGGYRHGTEVYIRINLVRK